MVGFVPLPTLRLLMNGGFPFHFYPPYFTTLLATIQHLTHATLAYAPYEFYHLLIRQMRLTS
jgi:hypothetical protein